MPSVAPCKPCEAKRWLERAGYKLALETASNWFLVHEDEAAQLRFPGWYSTYRYGSPTTWRAGLAWPPT